MLEFHFDPPISTAASDGGFVQTITMSDEGQVIGVARWHTAADAVSGVVQILDFTIAEKYRRKGFGKRLLIAVRDQAFELHRRKKTQLRRIWIGLDQKSQIIGRAFITSSGFHHIATVSELHRDQDLMVYVKSAD